MDAAKRTSDQFTIAYTVWIALLFAWLLFVRELGQASDFSILVIILLWLLPTVLVALTWLANLIMNLIRLRWRRVLSGLAAPFFAFALFWILGWAGVDTKRIRFELSKQYYLDQVTELPADKPRFKQFQWGEVGGGIVGVTLWTLIYDESDEIALPTEKRSADWRGAPGPSCESICEIEIRKMAEHFYLVTTTY